MPRLTTTCLVAAYALAWEIQSLVGFDFHSLAFAVPILAVAIERADAGRWKAATIWVLIATAGKGRSGPGCGRVWGLRLPPRTATARSVHNHRRCYCFRASGRPRRAGFLRWNIPALVLRGTGSRAMAGLAICHNAPHSDITGDGVAENQAWPPGLGVPAGCTAIPRIADRDFGRASPFGARTLGATQRVVRRSPVQCPFGPDHRHGRYRRPVALRALA